MGYLWSLKQDTYLYFSHELDECILNRVIEGEWNQEKQRKRRI